MPVLLQRGDRLPDFAAPTIDGGYFRNADVWQQRNLLAIHTTLASPAVVDYVSDLRARVAALVPDNSTVVAVRNVPALPVSTLILCDRWGEIVLAAPLSADVGQGRRPTIFSSGSPWCVTGVERPVVTRHVRVTR